MLQEIEYLVDLFNHADFKLKEMQERKNNAAIQYVPTITSQVEKISKYIEVVEYKLRKLNFSLLSVERKLKYRLKYQLFFRRLMDMEKQIQTAQQLI